ncbi:predicted membrane protein [Hahella chejuensis KCTC 2396]|uniref:Predicted membrane protein n=1 Tax=Hahella chejuensis (strain KCTC 2396) TaxID=349521 RepID=Q2SQN5_HAHCH|nr:DUF2339 domain-containing protein [Hahella chejuensis]ABC27039.1 predicted membrane protein [Hahella chejuensis KCTC 2396]
MDILILLVVGAVVGGAALQSFGGALMGAALGALAASFHRLQIKVQKLEKKVSAFEKARSEPVAAPPPTVDLPLASNMEIAPSPQPMATTSTTVTESVTVLGEVDEVREKVEDASLDISDLQLDLEPPSAQAAEMGQTSDTTSTMPETEPSLEEPAITQAPPAKVVQPDSLRAASAEPPAPNIADKVMAWVTNYFTGGNIVVRVGVIILFFGVAFLLKYASQKVVIPLELRYLGVAAGAAAMFAIGWRLRRKNQSYGLIMQGGAIGLLYIIIFAAFRLHGLLSSLTSFSLMVAVVCCGILIAVLQNAHALAAVSVIGGFAAPILASTGQGSHVELFTYYLLLNLGVTAIAWFKSWRTLNWLGFVFTFGIGMIWGAQYYTPMFFHSTEPFLIAFAVMYSLIALLFALRQPPNLKGLVDGTLVFGTPTVFIALQSLMVKDTQYAMAWSSAGVGVFYLTLSLLVRARPQMRLLYECYLALTVAFLTLAIPLAFDGRVTSALWAVEGVALFWVGARQQRLLPRFSGLGLMLFGGGMYLTEPPSQEPQWFVLNADFIGTLLVAIAGGLAARIAMRYQDRLLRQEVQWAPIILSLWAYAWWMAGGLFEIHRHIADTHLPIAGSLFTVLTAAACQFFAGRWRSPHLPWLAMASFVIGVIHLFMHYQVDARAIAWLNADFLASMTLVSYALGAGIFAWRGEQSRYFAPAEMVNALVLGVAVALGSLAGGVEAAEQYPSAMEASAFLLFYTFFIGVFALSYLRLQWATAAYPALLLAPAILLVLFIYVLEYRALYANAGWLAFPVAWAAHFGYLRLIQDRVRAPVGLFHCVMLLALIFAITWQIHFEITGEYDPETMAGQAIWGLVPALALLALRRGMSSVWPFRRYPNELLQWLPRAIMASVGLWMLWSNMVAPANKGLALLNPLDLVNLLALWVLWTEVRRHGALDALKQRVASYGVVAAFCFLWLNAALFRAFHFSLAIPYRFDDMVSSIVVQSGMSLLWSIAGMLCMLVGARRAHRSVWMIGGGLMVAVVAKLFLFDLSGTGTVARIVAFISVGVVLLLVGYFAPVPPREGAEKAPSSEAESGVE